MAKTKIDVGLLWHNYPSENFGVGALTFSSITLVERVAKKLGVEVSYYIAGMMPAEANAFGEITTSPCRYEQFSLKKLLVSPTRLARVSRNLSQCDFVIDLSEGDSFTDIYGLKRLLAQSLGKLLACRGKGRLILAPQTIGPFETAFGKFVAGRLLRNSKHSFARDGQSLDYANSISPMAKVSLATDVAFCLPFVRPSGRVSCDEINVGINVSGLLMSGGYAKGNQFGLRLDYPQFIRDVLKYFSGQSNVKVHLVSHVLSSTYAVEDDYAQSLLVAEEFPGVVVAPRFENPIDAKNYISSLDFFSGARMHATIAAFSSEVPVLPVAYSRKFAGLFGSLGYSHLIDGKSETTEVALSKLKLAFESRAQLKEDVVKGNAIARDRLTTYSKYLEQVILECIDG